MKRILVGWMAMALMVILSLSKSFAAPFYEGKILKITFSIKPEWLSRADRCNPTDVGA